MNRMALLLFLLGLLSPLHAPAQTVTASSREELVGLVKQAGPGTTIVLAPGDYKGGLHFSDLHGEAGKPITITGGSNDTLPVIRGGSSCIQISRSSHLVIERLHLEGATGNNLNIDDGGTIEKPSHHITLRNFVVVEVNASGNNDGIKLSGVTDFAVEDCEVRNWGKGGSGIDMVGCHRGVIRGCTLARDNKDGASGIQCKGGSSEVRIFKSTFVNAGARHINIGGSTGRAFFRPRLGETDNAEARDIEVAGCSFRGYGVPIAFVGVDGANVHHNTLYHPGPWVFRILQETTGEDFIACRNGVFTDNIVVYNMADLRTTVNIGPNTKPASFTFARNWWYCEDEPGNSKPKLPTKETDGVYNTDPKVDKQGRVTRTSPAFDVAGRQAWPGEDQEIE